MIKELDSPYQNLGKGLKSPLKKAFGKYNIKSIEIGRQFLQKDRPNTFEGYVIICGLRFFPIGGQRIESNWRPENDKYSDIKVFFGSKYWLDC